MADEPNQLVRLAKQLMEATRAGQLGWTQVQLERSDKPETTDFKPKLPLKSGAVRIRSRDKDGLPPFRLVLYDSSGTRIDALESQWDDQDEPAAWNELLQQLYEAARADAIDVKGTVTAILDELAETVPPEYEPPQQRPKRNVS